MNRRSLLLALSSSLALGGACARTSGPTSSTPPAPAPSARATRSRRRTACGASSSTGQPLEHLRRRRGGNIAMPLIGLVKVGGHPRVRPRARLRPSSPRGSCASPTSPSRWTPIGVLHPGRGHDLRPSILCQRQAVRDRGGDRPPVRPPAARDYAFTPARAGTVSSPHRADDLSRAAGDTIVIKSVLLTRSGAFCASDSDSPNPVRNSRARPAAGTASTCPAGGCLNDPPISQASDQATAERSERSRQVAWSSLSCLRSSPGLTDFALRRFGPGCRRRRLVHGRRFRQSASAAHPARLPCPRGRPLPACARISPASRRRPDTRSASSATLPPGASGPNRALADLAPCLALGHHPPADAAQPAPLDLGTLRAVSRRAEAVGATVLHGHGAKGGDYARLAMVQGNRSDPRLHPPTGAATTTARDVHHRLYMSIERMLALRTDVSCLRASTSPAGTGPMRATQSHHPHRA